MINAINLEILPIAESVAREKGIPLDKVLRAMADAVAGSARSKYGREHNIKAEINAKSGEIKLYKVLTIVEVVENYSTQISLVEAQEQDENLKVGQEVLELLPPIDLGRVAAQSAKQIIIQEVKKAEREKQYNEFKDRVGEILGGIVKRIEFGNIIVELNRAEAIIKRDQLIRNEIFKVNDHIKAYVNEVNRETKGPQIFLSRNNNEFLAKLLELEVPEIYEGQIEVMAVARDAGSKAKVAVFASDNSIDAVGACIGIKGNRIKAVSNQLNGEKIDVVLWDKDLAQFIVRVMAPAEITKVVIHENRKAVEIIVPTEHLSMAIGRRGQNVKLASELIGWHIEVMTDEQESKRRAEEFNNATELFMQALDVEEVLAQLLVVEGFNSIEQILFTEKSVLTNIEGFDEELVAELKNRADNWMQQKNSSILTKLEALGVEQDLLDALELRLEDILTLAENGIKSLEDLGEITATELRQILPNFEFSNEDFEILLRKINPDSK